MIIGRMKLLELARKASKAIRPSITPIKESLKIEAANGKLQITGMSTEMVICAYDEIEDNTSFTCVVNAKIFTDILNKMVSDTVELSLVKSDSDEIDVLVIKGGISSLDIQTFDAASWSDLPKFTPKIKLKVNPKYFQEVMEEFGPNPKECLMVGNDVQEDLTIRSLGVKTYLLTDTLENKKNIPLEEVETEYKGTMEELYEWFQSYFVHN